MEEEDRDAAWLALARYTTNDLVDRGVATEVEMLYHNPVPFAVGDFVRLLKGQAPQEVTEVRPGWIKARYLSAREYTTAWGTTYRSEWRRVTDYIRFEENKETEEMTTKSVECKARLYQTKEGERFGTLLATNSAGKLVLEMKGTGNVETFDPSDVEVVRPYTVELVRIGGRAVNLRVPKDLLKVGDLVLETSGGYGLAVVRRLDTKQEGCAAAKGLRRIDTELLPIVKGEVEVDDTADDDGI